MAKSKAQNIKRMDTNCHIFDMVQTSPNVEIVKPLMTVV